MLHTAESTQPVEELATENERLWRGGSYIISYYLHNLSIRQGVRGWNQFAINLPQVCLIELHSQVV